MSNKPYWLEILEEAMPSNKEFEDIIITTYGYVGISEKKAAIKLDFDCVICNGKPHKEGEAELDIFLLPNDKVKVAIKDIKITCPEKGYHIHRELNKRIKTINRRSK